MINPILFLKEANKLVPIKQPKKGQKPVHSLYLDDNGETNLSIVINQEKGVFHRIKLNKNDDPATIINRCRDKVLALVKKNPVK